jgi:hypothetical protein
MARQTADFMISPFGFSFDAELRRVKQDWPLRPAVAVAMHARYRDIRRGAYDTRAAGVDAIGNRVAGNRRMAAIQIPASLQAFRDRRQQELHCAPRSGRRCGH